MKNDIITNAIGKNGYKTPFNDANTDTKNFRNQKYGELNDRNVYNHIIDNDSNLNAKALPPPDPNHGLKENVIYKLA